MTMTEKDRTPKTSVRARWPGWVPESALNYITHTEKGLSIRALARQKGCHPSTVLRQIRRIEARRDDPLVDEALQHLGDVRDVNGSGLYIKKSTQAPDMDAEIMPVLKVLSMQGRILAIADHLEKAAIVDTGRSAIGAPFPVARDIALLLALRGWIACRKLGRVNQYAITQAGRVALGQMVAQRETARQKARDLADPGDPLWQDSDDGGTGGRTSYGESPVFMLARRRDRQGVPFLSQDLVDAAERLRQDFVLSEMRPEDAAGARVRAALDDLGPGLSDVVLRCCCHLEGLESAERDMGWSARSGKIVLRIALQRLRCHYAQAGQDAGLIG